MIGSRVPYWIQRVLGSLRRSGSEESDGSLCSARVAVAVAAFAAIAVVVAGIALYARSGRGLHARYYEVRDDARELVDEGVEHQTWFRNPLRVADRMAGRWTAEREPTKRSVEVELTGRLHVPPGSPRVLRARSPNQVSIAVDGRDATDQRVEPGEHDLRVLWQIRKVPAPQATPSETQRGRYREPTAQLALTWSDRPGRRRVFRRIGSRHFRVPHEHAVDAVWAGIGVAVSALLLGFVVFFVIRRWRAGGRRWAVRFAVLALLAAALGLRLWQVGAVPTVSASEMALVGASLDAWGGGDPGAVMYGQTPVDKSGLPKRIITRRWHGPFAKAYFGSVALVSPAQPTPALFRLMSVFLGVLCTGLVFLLARGLGTAWPVPWVAAGIHAVLPLTVLNGRVVAGEALVAPLGVAAVLSARAILDAPTTRTRWCAAACAGLAAASAPIGIVLAVGLAVGLARAADLREAGRFLLGGSLVAVATIAVVLWFTGETILVDVLPDRAANPWGGPVRFLSWPVIAGDEVGRGWGLFLWLSTAIVLLVRTERNSPLPRSLELVALPLVILLASTLVWANQSRSGWWLVVTPFLAVGGAQFLADQWRRPHLIGGLLFVGLGVMYGLNFFLPVQRAIHPHYAEQTRQVVTAVLAVGVAPFLFAHLIPMRFARIGTRAVLLAGLVLIAASSAYFTWHYVDHNERGYRHFDRQHFFNA